MARRAWVAAGLTVVMVAGCSGPQESTKGAGPAQGAVDGPKPAAGPCGALADVRNRPCPRSGERCETEGWRCECYEETGNRCSGAVMPPRPPGPVVWHCVPIDPATPREDGCPWGIPRTGTPCAPEGRTCAYPAPCGGGWGQATCAKGAWSVEEGIVSNPP